MDPKYWIKEIIGFIWALPVTIIGILFLLACGGPTQIKRQEHKLAWWIKPRWFLLGRKFIACCLGAVIIHDFREFLSSDRHRFNQMIDHELQHQRQCFILGPFILILYPIFSLCALVLYGSAYRANWLEMMARHAAGEEIKP